MENDTNDEMDGKSLLAEHVALLLEGKLDELNFVLQTEVFDVEYFFEMHDEAFTAERVLRKDRYGPLVRRWEAASAAFKGGTMSEADYEAADELLQREMQALEEEVWPAAIARFARNVLNIAYVDPDLKSISPDTREAFLDAVRSAMGDMVDHHTGIDPEDDGPYE